MAGIVSPMLAIAEPSARLKLVWMRSRARVADRGEGLGQQDEQRDDHADRRLRGPTAATASSIAGDSILASPTTATRATHQQSEASQRRPARRRLGVPLVVTVVVADGHEVVAVAHGLDDHEQP